MCLSRLQVDVPPLYPSPSRWRNHLNPQNRTLLLPRCILCARVCVCACEHVRMQDAQTSLIVCRRSDKSFGNTDNAVAVQWKRRKNRLFYEIIIIIPKFMGTYAVNPWNTHIEWLMCGRISDQLDCVSRIVFFVVVSNIVYAKKKYSNSKFFISARCKFILLFSWTAILGNFQANCQYNCFRSTVHCFLERTDSDFVHV